MGTVENVQFVFHGFHLRGSFHSLRSQKHFLQRCVKKTWATFLSNEFLVVDEWYGLRGRGELSTQPVWVDNSVLVRQLRGPNFRMWP